MKKAVRILALSLVFVMLALVLVACKPNSDYNKAKEKLEKDGYKVSLLTDSISTTGAEVYYGIEGVEALLTASKKVGDKYEAVSIMYFKDSASAKNAMKKIDSKENDEDDDDEDELNSKYVKRTQSGKMIYAGSKNGIKAAS